MQATGRGVLGETMEVGPGVPVGIELRTSDEHVARRFYGPLLGWDVDHREAAAPITCRFDGDDVATVRVDDTDPGAWRIVLADGGSHIGERVGEAGGATFDVGPNLRDIVDPLGAVCSVDERADHIPLRPGWGRASWFEIMTTDVEATDRFYRSVFDYGVWAPDGPPDGPYAVLTVGGQPVAGRLALPPDLAELIGDRWMTYLAVRDVDAALAHAGRLGGAVLVPPRDAPTGRLAAVRDPCGAIFTLLTPAASP